MKFTTRYSIISLLLPMLLIAGCAKPVKEQAHSGFLGDYSKLEKVGDAHYYYASRDLANYSSFMIDPVVILYAEDPEKPVFTPEELDDLKAHFVDKLTKALTKDGAYQIVDTPGPGVGRFRIGITKLDASTGALNVVIWTKVTGAGLGGIATESELVDSITGKQLVAGIRWGSGSRILRAGFTRAGDAKILVNRWIKKFRERLDEAHGASK